MARGGGPRVVVAARRIFGRSDDVVAKRLDRLVDNHFRLLLLRDGQVAGRAHAHVVVD